MRTISVTYGVIGGHVIGKGAGQAQTRWNPGLTDETITQYEVAVGASFHPDFKTFLRCMNGTDIPAIDVRGSSGEPPRAAVLLVSSRPRTDKNAH